MQSVYVLFVRRWWWLVVIGAALAIAVVYNSVRNQQSLYVAHATIQIGRAFESRNPDQQEIAIVGQLVQTYAALAARDPILLASAQALNLPLGPDDLRARLLVTPQFSVPLIDIMVIDTDPVRAAVIANEIARQLVLQSPSSSNEDDASRAFTQGQLVDLEGKITRGLVDVAALEDEITALTSATDIDNARRKLSSLQAQIESWQESYARLASSVEPSQTNLVTIVSKAMPSSIPVPQQNTLNYMLAFVIGAGLATLLALALELFNRAVTSAEELERLVNGLPIITIPRYRAPHQGTLVLDMQPGSSAASAYRRLRNILFANTPATGITVAITSSRVAEGKTTTAANLALALAHAGRSVILADTNLRNPELDLRFGIAPAPGFSELVQGKCTLEEALQRGEHKCLRILAAGTVADDYADLLSNQRVGDTVAALAQAAEIVVFDTGAVGEEQDVLLLTKYVDSVLLVAEAGRVQQDQIQEALELVGHAKARVVAVVLNKVQQPRFSPEFLPWSREARNRARAQQRRRVHRWTPGDGEASRAPGD